MIFINGYQKTHLQYLIFYENLETQYKKALNLYDEVQIEIDRIGEEKYREFEREEQ